MVSTEQSKQWNGETGQYWVEREEHFDAMLSRLTTHLVAAADISATDRVVDIGCGCGATTREAAARASEGAVLGIDLSEPMLERARVRAEHQGLTNVRFEWADAEVYPFPRTAFDLVISRFGVMFFEDPRAAFHNIGEALRPGGRIAFLCWQELARNEQRTVPLEALAAHIEFPDAPPPEGPGPFSLADPDRVRGLLAGAGFSDIGVEPVLEPVLVGANADEAAEFTRHLPPIQSLLTDVDEDTLAVAVASLRESFVAYESPAGVLLGSATWLVTARRS